MFAKPVDKTVVQMQLSRNIRCVAISDDHVARVRAVSHKVGNVANTRCGATLAQPIGWFHLTSSAYLGAESKDLEFGEKGSHEATDRRTRAHLLPPAFRGRADLR